MLALSRSLRSQHNFHCPLYFPTINRHFNFQQSSSFLRFDHAKHSYIESRKKSLYNQLPPFPLMIILKDNNKIDLRYLSSNLPSKDSLNTTEDDNPSSFTLTNIKTKSIDFAKSIPSIIKTLPTKIKNLPAQMKTWPAFIKKEAHHYWVGSKLFALEVKTSSGIIRGILNGKELSRRERKLLITTFNDLLRLIPFAIIVIIPFMEFTLPFLLRIFPNMLPSTFEDKLKKEESLKKRLKARLRFAKFLQDAAEELAEKQTPADGGSTKNGPDLLAFMKKVKAGEPVSNDEILSFAKAFEDELTLDNLQRPQLVTMCKYMDLHAFGGDSILRFQLNQKLKQLKADDMLIQKEGINSLSVEELQHALRSRGMRGNSTSKLVLRRRLSEWLDLSLNHNLPASVLVLSRALVITEKGDYEDRLKETLSSLPDDLVEEVKLKIDESHGTATSDFKYEVLKSQNELILEESKLKQFEHLPDDHHSSTDGKFKEISEAVSVLSSTSSVKKERAELNELKADQETLKADRESRERQRKVDEYSKKEKDIIFSPSSPLTSSTLNTETSSAGNLTHWVKIGDQQMKASEIIEKKASTDSLGKKLTQRLDKMVQEIEQEVENVEEAVGMKLSILDKDGDGVISASELADALGLMRDKLSKEKVDEIISKVDRDHDGKISLEELLEYADGHSKLKKIKQPKDSENIQ